MSVKLLPILVPLGKLIIKFVRLVRFLSGGSLGWISLFDTLSLNERLKIPDCH
jgi:hypothetical protein